MFARPPCVSCWIDGTFLLRCHRDMRNYCPRVRLELVVSALQSADVGKSSALQTYTQMRGIVCREFQKCGYFWDIQYVELS